MMLSEEKERSGMKLSKWIDFSGIENIPHTTRIILHLSKPKKGTAKKFAGDLLNIFPELKGITDEELGKVIE